MRSCALAAFLSGRAPARTPEQAAEIYIASLLAIDVDDPAERRYLAMQAAHFKLDDKLVARLHATVKGVAQQAVSWAKERKNLDSRFPPSLFELRRTGT